MEVHVHFPSRRWRGEMQRRVEARYQEMSQYGLGAATDVKLSPSSLLPFFASWRIRVAVGKSTTNVAVLISQTRDEYCGEFFFDSHSTPSRLSFFFCYSFQVELQHLGLTTSWVKENISSSLRKSRLTMSKKF